MQRETMLRRLRRAPQPAVGANTVFEWSFNIISLINGLLILISNIIRFIRDLDQPTSA